MAKTKQSMEKPIWLNISEEELKKIIVELAGKYQPAQIGLVLRDSYGIPNSRKISNKKVNQILKEHKLEQKIPEDLTALIKKEVIIIKHLENNKHDMPSRHGLLLTESKIRRLTKYYKRTGILPQDWAYSRAQAKITI